MTNGLKRTPWSRRHALKVLEKIGVECPEEAYRGLRKRWVADNKVPAELKVHIILCGAVCEWLEDLAQLQLIRCVERQERLSEECPIEKVSSSILSNLATDIGAMLVLCASGYDVQARGLLRGFIEKLDILICARYDTEFASSYLESQSFLDSRDFFYKNVSGGKLSKKARKLFKANFPDVDFIHDWVLFEWRAETNLMLASAVHSSHAVGMLSLFPNLGRGRSNAVGFGGHASNGSNVTISKIFISCMPLHFIFMSYPYEEVFKYLEDAKVETIKIEKRRAYRGLLLTFSLVDAWLQDLDAAVKAVPADRDS